MLTGMVTTGSFGVTINQGGSGRYFCEGRTNR